MSNKKKLINARRRTFLQSSALLTAASAGATSAVASVDTAGDVQQPAEELKGSAGYQETDRVRRYYKMARF